MHALTLTLGASLLLPGLRFMYGQAASVSMARDCHGTVCSAEEYCSNYEESCAPCSRICDADTHNYDAIKCAKECPDYQKYEPLREEIHSLHMQQHIIIILLAISLGLIVIRYICNCLHWLRHNRTFVMTLKKLQTNKQEQPPMGKDLGGTTISNVMAINDLERAPSQIYSVTGAEGSVMTMTTPVSTRYPAENSTTPTTIAAEYSYDNQALAITPVSEKPNGGPI